MFSNSCVINDKISEIENGEIIFTPEKNDTVSVFYDKKYIKY